MSQTKITFRSIEPSSIQNKNLDTGAVTNEKIAANTITESKFSEEALADSNDIGSIIWYCGSTPPAGYLYADGSVLQRSSYLNLFNKIGTTYNQGNEQATEFRLPDLRGKFVRGWNSNSNQTPNTLDQGRVFGSDQDYDWKGFSFTNINHANGAGGANDGRYPPQWYSAHVWMGESTTNYIGNIMGGYWSANAATLGMKWDHSEIRPKNIALLPCIKNAHVYATKKPSLNIQGIVDSKFNTTGGTIDGNLTFLGSFLGSRLTAIATKSGASSYNNVYRNNWNKGWGLNTDMFDWSSSASAITVKIAGYYEVRGWQRALGNGGNPFFCVALNGNRESLEYRADGIWTHSHTGGSYGSFTWSMYFGWLDANSIITGGPPNNSDGSGGPYLWYNTAANTGWTGGMYVRPLNRY